MQLKKLFILSAAALLSATPSKSTAQSWIWTTVQDYQFNPGYSSAGFCLAADAAGDVFAGGFGYLANGSETGRVLKTTDADETIWSQIDDSNPNSFVPPQHGIQTTIHGLGFDSSGRYLYESGTWLSQCIPGSCAEAYWYIRWTTDLGVTWMTDPLWQYPGGTNSSALGLAADGSGNIFVVGFAQDANAMDHWVVRKGVPGPTQTTWTMVDDIGGSGAHANGIGFVPGVGVFAIGWTNTVTNGKHGSTTNYSWVVRRSTDDGVKWKTVDQFQAPTGYFAEPWGVGADGQGNIYVAGYTIVLGKHSTAIQQWLVRKSANGGNTWATVDAFSYVPGAWSLALGLGRDSAGNVVVVGTAWASPTENVWVVRSPNAQGVWQTLDAYQEPGAYLYAWDVVADAAGNLLVIGEAEFETGPSYWIVRKGTP